MPTINVLSKKVEKYSIFSPENLEKSQYILHWRVVAMSVQLQGSIMITNAVVVFKFI